MTRYVTLITVLLCAVCILFGCGEPPQETEEKQGVITKKMTAKPEPMTTPAAEGENDAGVPAAESDKPVLAAAESDGSSSSAVDAKPSDTTAPPAKEGDATTGETDGRTRQDAPSEVAGTDAESKPAETVVGEEATGGETTDIDLASGEAPGQAEDDGDLLAYVVDGKVDPFVPLFRDEPEPEPEPEVETADENAPAIPAPPPRRKTPLEKLDLSQLKLVAIVRAPAGNKALVEEASGKGYIITHGTYIGINSGRVVEILKDRVIVEEEEKDYRQNVTIRTRELKFQRPYGEE